VSEWDGPNPMRHLATFCGKISAPAYALAVPALILSQHLMVALLYRAAAVPLAPNRGFWLLPMRRLADMPALSPWTAAAAFGFSLAVTWAIATLSFRRAARSGYGYTLAAASIVPVLQIGAVALLAVAPVRAVDLEPEQARGANLAHVVQGVLAGVAIIVLAVLISAVTFGAYGWSLFVMTPFLVGITTAYLANRSVALAPGQTFGLVMAAAGLGTLALVMFALEGFVCILLAAPLGSVVALVGGAIGRGLAAIGHRRGKPLLSVALLPVMFALEAAMPPSVAITMEQAIDISAPPSAVWQAVVSDDPIGPPPALVEAAGFSYPVGGRLLGNGVGAVRLGEFSTGVARERVTDWLPDRRLAFVVESQAPMMEEMSPYRRVHAPHLSGYFETSATAFDLKPLPGGKTRLSVSATHTLRIDPALYWEPMARWAISQNVHRVLRSIKGRVELNASIQRSKDRFRDHLSVR
jgi:hypothetical protein